MIDNSDHSLLFAPLICKSLNLRNRLVMAPKMRHFHDDNPLARWRSTTSRGHAVGGAIVPQHRRAGPSAGGDAASADLVARARFDQLVAYDPASITHILEPTAA